MSDDERADLQTELRDFKECTKRYRIQVLSELKTINTALFAKDSDNEHEQVGLMVTARNIDKHITVTCNFARWGIAAAVGITGLIAFVHAVGTLL
tara:strand:+ start:93 stop:377 length:285 start_codon:yes stop_codon:yes gene_type:complete